MNYTTLMEAAVKGNRLSLSKAITALETREPGAQSALTDLCVGRRSGPGVPHVIGFTGPPGAGKSTFVSRAITEARALGKRVAVVAVDPSSPFSGGAILGDRIRMSAHVDDEGVFVRSLSSRGQLGGLSFAANDVVDLFDAVGFDVVLIETVGVGQSELSVMEVADTVVVILTPESGDTVQTMKAGLLEVADLFVVNKQDRPGADLLIRELNSMVALDDADPDHVAQVYGASARDGVGIAEVMTGCSAHLEWLKGAGLSHWSHRRGLASRHALLDLIAQNAREKGKRWLVDNPDVESKLVDRSLSVSAVWEAYSEDI